MPVRYLEKKSTYKMKTSKDLEMIRILKSFKIANIDPYVISENLFWQFQMPTIYEISPKFEKFLNEESKSNINAYGNAVTNYFETKIEKGAFTFQAS